MKNYRFGLAGMLRLHRKAVAALVGLILFMAALGIVTYDAIEDSLQDVLAKNLMAVIDADATALRIWMDNEKREARLWAQRDMMNREIHALLQTAERSSESRYELLQAPEQATLRQLLENDQPGQAKRGFLLIARTGLILASDDDRYVGRTLNAEGMRVLGTVLDKGSLITHPFREGALVNDIPTTPGRIRMLAAAPVQNSEPQPVAILAFVIDPELDFTRILSVAHIGETGNTYAFNREGVLLSDSRFEPQLKRIGLLPDTPEAQSILNIEIRDPGGDLTRGYEPERLPAGQPLTRMAAAAVSGHDGVDVEGYRDFRGVKVLGAWRWLPEYDMGIATEVTLGEALRAILPLTLAYWILFGALVVTILVALIANMIIHRLRRRIHETQRIDRYTLERRIGAGGMGEVFLARHMLLRRPTAIKLLRADKVGAEVLARFEREVQLTSCLQHPNTIGIYDYGHTPEGIFYYVMEYLDGITLARLIEIEGAVAPARAAAILRQVCASLQEAHSVGLIHRDIKPLNIILCQLGGEPDFVKVLDFGLVKEIELPEDQRLTQTHSITGTPLYIAPERLRDPQRIDARCDIYSLGVVAFNLLTGRDLYQGANALELSHHTLYSPIPRPADHSPHRVPPQFDDLVVQCLAKDPDLRPASARELLDRLDAIPFDAPWDWEKARRWWEAHAADAHTFGHRESGSGETAGKGESATLPVRHQAA